MRIAAQALLATLLLLVGVLPSRAAEVVTLQLRGSISARSLEQFVAGVERARGDPQPAGLIVLLDSPGGDGLAAMRIGRLARAHQAHVFVRGRCASACVFVLAGGVVRGAADGAVGLHRGTLTTFKPGVGSVPAALPKDEERAMLDYFESEAARYFAEMGLPPETIGTMLAIPANTMRWISRDEAARLGLVGVDARYARERARAATGGDEQRFAERSLEAPRVCAFDPPAAFIDCYRRTLEGKGEGKGEGERASAGAKP